MTYTQIFNINSEEEFNRISVELCKFQYQNCETYRDYCNNLGVDVDLVDHYLKIPFLPIEIFKYREVVTKGTKSFGSQSITFTSSGTTGMQRSYNHISDIDVYRESFRRAFQLFYGDISDYCILALLPSYLERQGSSLIYMVEDMIERSKHPKSSFYLYDHDNLYKTILQLENSNQKVLLLGVTFALLDFVKEYQLQLHNTIVMETGGMKGRGQELIKEELHCILKRGFGVNSIHSEYGMCELLSQAYSCGDGIFRTPPWMRVISRDADNPLKIKPHSLRGGLNVIDLANINSCAFIATQDLVNSYPDNSFEILGRFDNSDTRGCSLLL